MDTNDWMPRMEQVEARVKSLTDALLGTLDGKPGLRAQMDNLVDLVERNSEISTRNNEQLDALRLDKAKVVGIVLATGTLVGLGIKLLHL